MDDALWMRTIVTAHTKGLPFVCFAVPEQGVAHLYIQQDSKLYRTKDFSETAFVMAPFLLNDEVYAIPKSVCEVYEVPLPKTAITPEEFFVPETDAERENHMSLVARTISKIETETVQKVVVSRRKQLTIPNFSLTILLKRLFSMYPDAFRYVWYHPKTGLWCGASPEVLFQTDDSAFTTMALAGTQKVDARYEPNWSRKELEEQEIVTLAIRDSLQRIASVLKFSKTYTHRAGSLAHLRTDITGILKKGKGDLVAIAKALHPTPAVCGVPRQASASFITEQEGYDREFYTGFMGPVAHAELNSQLYVNLRCMKIEDNQAFVYVGGGITKASLPEAEWEETQNKLQTMLQVLAPML